MQPTKSRPEIMSQAATDLAGNLSGRFSPGDWEAILERAEVRLNEQMRAGRDAASAWQEVVREFHRERYWGRTPNYKAPKGASLPEVNLGVKFILLSGLTMTVTLIAVVWLGQKYTTSGDPRDGRILYAVIGLAVLNFALFLWRHRRHKD